MMLDYDRSMARDIRRMRSDLRAAEARFGETAMARSGLSRGQVLRHRDTGHRYRLEAVHATPSLGPEGVSATVVGRRVYRTGRRPAAATSLLELSDMELL